MKTVVYFTRRICYNKLIINQYNKENQMSNLRLTPFYAVKPGETIMETLECLGLTIKQIADEVGITEKMMIEIIDAERPVTRDVAEVLHLRSGVSTKFWLNLEANYQKDLTSLQKRK